MKRKRSCKQNPNPIRNENGIVYTGLFGQIPTFKQKLTTESDEMVLF